MAGFFIGSGKSGTQASLGLGGSVVGTALQELLMCDDLQPGAQPSYELCKQIYAFHPLGKKMVDSPIALAQSQERKITIASGPEEALRKQFNLTWAELNSTKIIFNTARQARAYGISSAALLAKDQPTDKPIDYKKLPDMDISFNVFDPLNTAGSLVLNQDPNAMDFQKVKQLSVSSVAYHPTRVCVVMNEDPLYIEYTTSAYGFVGRSVYQRALLPLKTFVQSMITDDMVVRKVGVLIAMLKNAGSIVNNAMVWAAGFKRRLLKEAQTDNVISIDKDEKVESLNLQNLEGPYGVARKNVLENVAVAADMPAKLLNQETFAEGFGEGTEDAKAVARYVDSVRIGMKPLYDWMDKIVKYRAWSPAFYKTLQKEYPDMYSGVTYETAFYDWMESFSATWPNLLEEPDSEKAKTEDVKLKGIIALSEVLLPIVDPMNKGILVEWMTSEASSNKIMFSSPLVLDIEALQNYEPPVAEPALTEPKPAHPFAAQDSAKDTAIVAEAIRRLLNRRQSGNGDVTVQ